MMIKRKGNKTDRTIMMENAVYDYFKSYLRINLKPEVPVSSGIADFVGHTEDKRDYVVIEIKQSAADFYSGCGLNFVGSSNYIAVPSELVGFTIVFLRDNNYSNIGVLEITDAGTVRIVAYPHIQRENDFLNRYQFGPAAFFFTPPHLRILET